MGAVRRAVVVGVPVEELRAAVALARVMGRGDADGVTWSAAEWERLWTLLTPLQQHVVYGCVFVGLTHQEAGEELGIGRGAVHGHWRRALLRIRAAMPVPAQR